MRQIVHFVGDRRREERRLAHSGRAPQDSLDGRQEADVEHAVSLVEHGDAHPIQRQRAALQMVFHAARCTDHDVDAAHECSGLRAEPDAAVDRQHAHAGVLPQTRQLLCHLQAQLARGHELDSLHGAHARVDRLNQGDAEAGRLPGPSLRLSQHIAAGTQRGDRLLLDGGRRRVAHGGQGAGDRPIDGERAEEVQRLGRN